MTQDPVVSNRKEVARLGWRATLASLAAGLIFFVLLILGLAGVIRSPQIGDTFKVMSLIAVTLGVLFFGLAIIGDLTIRKYGWKWDSPGLILVWVYLVPAIYFLCLCLGFTIYSQDILWTLFSSVWILLNRVPVLWFWQVILLIWFLLRVKRVDPRSVFQLRGRELTTACLAGLGLGLVFIFILSIESNLFPSLQVNLPGDFPTSPVMQGLLLVFALTLLPWAEENYFRGLLHDWLGTRLANAGVLFISAFLFAILTFRLHLFLPGLALGLGLGILRRRNGLQAATVAHAVCNLVILGLFPMIAV